MDTAAIVAALVSGSVIGLILGLVGGGGSILAVPLLIYVVGVGSPHAAIGTAAVAVTVNALASLIGHARARRVKWRCAGVFAVSGMIGAALGAELGKAFDGAEHDGRPDDDAGRRFGCRWSALRSEDDVVDLCTDGRSRRGRCALLIDHTRRARRRVDDQRLKD